MSGPYGADEGRPRRRSPGDPGDPVAPASQQAPWNDGARWARDQGQGQNRPGPDYPPGPNYPGQGYPAQGYPAQGQPGQGYPGQGYPGQGQPGQGQPYDGQDHRTAPGYGSQDFAGPGYDDRGYHQPSGRPLPAPASDDSFVPGFGPRGQAYADPRGIDPQGIDPRGADPRGADPRGADPRGADPRGAGPRGIDPRSAAPGGGRGPGPRGSGDQPRDPNWDMRRDRPRKKATRWLPRILLLVVFFAIVAGALVGGHFFYGKYEAKYHPADYAGAGVKPAVTVQVPSGETATGLAPTLVKLGVVASVRAFTNAVEASSNPTGLQAGFFTLNHHMKATLAWAALLNSKNRVELGVTIPEGKRTSQVILILAKETKIPAKKFQQVIDHPAKLDLPSYAKGKVEGYLFPATYPIEPKETALQILQAMVTRFKVESAQVDLPAAAKRIGLTPNQVIVEASMAQAEGGSISDYPKIARVIINRLHDGMPLQFDSVLLYGLHKYAINVTDKQIASKGPYNDFKHDGLPPGPISNPGDAAIQGILHPASGDWIYFLTNSGGKSTFSATPLQGQ